jgi:hypothetical protein
LDATPYRITGGVFGGGVAGDPRALSEMLKTLGAFEGSEPPAGRLVRFTRTAPLTDERDVRLGNKFAHRWAQSKLLVIE